MHHVVKFESDQVDARPLDETDVHFSDGEDKLFRFLQIRGTGRTVYYGRESYLRRRVVILPFKISVSDDPRKSVFFMILVWIRNSEF